MKKNVIPLKNAYQPILFVAKQFKSANMQLIAMMVPLGPYHFDAKVETFHLTLSDD